MQERLQPREGALGCARVARWIVILLISIVLWSVLIPDNNGSDSSGQALGFFIAILVAFLIWSYPILAIHEGGHLLAAWLLGFSVYWYVVGPLIIIRTRRGLRVELRRKGILSGSVFSYPKYDHHLRWRLAILAAGGPLANLFLAALGWWLWATVQKHAPALSFPVLLFASLVVISAVVGFGSLVPNQGRDHANDGLHLWRVLRGGRGGEYELIARRLNRFVLSGAPPRDWPSYLVLRQIVLAEKPGEEHYACVLAYCWALDTGDIPGAGAFLDRALATLPRPATPTPELALEAAYFEARYRARFDTARMWMSRNKGGRYDRVLRPRAEMAILLGEGQYEEALLYAAQGLAALEQLAYLDPGGLRMEEESLREMAAEAQQAREELLATAHQSRLLF